MGCMCLEEDGDGSRRGRQTSTEVLLLGIAGGLNGSLDFGAPTVLDFGTAMGLDFGAPMVLDFGAPMVLDLKWGLGSLAGLHSPSPRETLLSVVYR